MKRQTFFTLTVIFGSCFVEKRDKLRVNFFFFLIVRRAVPPFFVPHGAETDGLHGDDGREM